ncbi:PREDICTED: uncharacterized protein LOC107343341 [Acropora digitifera]|uniref:uncharacterized protein LOC107343341 n=1 Tax=Acropora digitifera TaxID=70779 RepID=UPI00077A022C|nr:PREDICTED: uncharacterized protein LOC107343341 [Acropora digitifera]
MIATAHAIIFLTIKLLQKIQQLVAQSKESEKMNSRDRELQKRIAERKEDERKWTELMEKHPRVGLLPSPELLTKGSICGQDVTNTLQDFSQTVHWLKNKEALNTDFYTYYTDGQDLKREEFGALIKLAFGNSVDAVRNTCNLTLDEYVIWYYAGHGRDNSSENQEILSMPKLEKVGISTTYNDSAKPFAEHLQNKPVKGGELCLHHVGYCGLYGLIAPWIASVKDESQNSAGVKKNKHFVIILDSCYAGMIAEDLKELNKEKGPWNENGCSITIQTACGPDETTDGGYFTPCFLTLNNDENLRDRLKNEWEAIEEQEKESFRGLPLPSPRVVTTRADSGQNSLTMEFNFNNSHKLTLFSDSGFFKFCSLSIFKEDELKEERVLNEMTARDFMNKNTPNFNILDYKLKTLQNGPFAGFPMGLFLIEETRNSKFAVCAHVHFAKEDTSKVGRINLVHHLTPPRNNILYVEDEGLSKRQVKKGKIQYAVVAKAEKPSEPDDWEYWNWREMDPSSSVSFNSQTDDQRSLLKGEVNKGAELVKACHDFVEHEEPGRWDDHTKWDMKITDLSHSGKFRQKERLQWMKQYMEEYEKSC